MRKMLDTLLNVIITACAGYLVGISLAAGVLTLLHLASNL